MATLMTRWMATRPNNIGPPYGQLFDASLQPYTKYLKPNFCKLLHKMDRYWQTIAMIDDDVFGLEWPQFQTRGDLNFITTSTGKIEKMFCVIRQVSRLALELSYRVLDGRKYIFH